jgi:hypothetical protein
MGPGAHPASYPISTKGEAAGSEANHSPPSSVEAKNVWSCTSTPPFLFMAWCLIKHTDKFAFTLQSQHAYPCRNEILLVRFEVLTAVFMESTIFWDIKPCSPLKVNRCFGATYRHHLQGRISRARNQRKAGGKQSSEYGSNVSPKRRLTFN